MDAPDSQQQTLPQSRVLSIDALRGFDMFWIIGGEKIFRSLHDVFDSPTTAWISTQLTHVRWEGFRFEDLIMPLFLFIVGAVMPYAFEKRLTKGDGKIRLYGHIVKRTLILFVLGMIAQGNLLEYDLSQLRIFSNTLQAIAAGYFVSAILILNLDLLRQLIATVALLILFWALMMLIPVPGHGAGVLTPEGNLAIYIDRAILGSFIDGTDPPYTWILSSMGFACTVMQGVMAGHLLRSKKNAMIKVLWLLGIGAACIVVGLLWHLAFPIIKHIWTGSFVLLSGGICYVLLGLFYLVIDVLGFRRWAFGFVVIGSNAIAVYMITRGAIARHFDFRRIGDIFITGLDQQLGDWSGLIHATAGFAVLWLVMWWMYRKKILIRI